MPFDDRMFWQPEVQSSGFVPRGDKPQYVHPYEDLASAAMPTSIQSALRWAQFIVTTTGPYRAALRRIIAYCITDPEIKERPGSGSEIGKEVRENYEKVFSDDCLQIKNETLAVGQDLLTYGNAFVSVFTEFTRYLSCTGHRSDGSACGAQIPLQHMLDNKGMYRFSFPNMEFEATCPQCGCRGKWKVYDLPSKSMSKIYVRRWSPLEIELLYDPFSKESTVVWNIPSDYASEVRRGLDHIIASVPMEVLDAIRNNGKLKFNKEAILHLRTASLSGLKLRGWGLPGTIADFRQAWMFQTCNRHTETTAMEALSPMRILSPAEVVNGGDPVHGTASAAQFKNMMSQAVNTKRRDPSAWFVSPIPIQYQALGGDASQFIPRELLDFSLDTLLTSAGVPVEMYKGTMTMQSAPVALRLFTSYWQSIVTDCNRFLKFAAQRVSDILGWEPVEVSYAKITQADDINRQVQALQLMGMGAVSQTTALASVGIDKQEEVRRITEEQRDEAEQQDRMQKEMETTKQLDEMVGGGTLNILSRQQQMQQQFMQPGGGGVPGMGMPGQNMPVPGGTMAGATVPGANGQGMSSLLPGADPISQMIAQSGIQPTDSIQDIYTKAETLAQQFLLGNTNSNLRKLKKQDPNLHMFVNGIINDIRSNADSQGGDMVMQQNFGGGR